MQESSESPQQFLPAVAAFIDARDLIAAGESVLVAVSGGCDSVALLDVLRRLAAEPGRRWKLACAHLNHKLRDDADADARFVRELADRLELPCIIEEADVPAIAAERSESVETAARAVRYEFFARAAGSVGATAVATGHHADDNVETILDRIVRGTHLRGLGGIPAERELAGERGIRIVRPLLAVRREQIEQFCLRHDLAWRDDPTNADTAYRRNFIRHELLPLLRDRINPRVDDALLRLAGAAGDSEEHLAAAGRELLAAARRRGPKRPDDPDPLVLDAAELADAPTLQRCYALRAAMEATGMPMGDMTAGQLADLAALPAQAPPAAMTLPGNFLARREFDELVIGKARGPVETPNWHLRLARDGEVTLPDGRCVRCEETAFDAAELARHREAPTAGAEWLDAEYVRGSLMLRPRRPGDAFVPLGAPGRQTVSDFLTNSKLPLARRAETFVVADEAGVVYLAPLRIADHVRVREGTRRVLRITVS